MKENIKRNLLKHTERVVKSAAIGGGGFPTWLGFHEPEQPEKLRKLIQKNKK